MVTKQSNGVLANRRADKRAWSGLFVKDVVNDEWGREWLSVVVHLVTERRPARDYHCSTDGRRLRRSTAQTAATGDILSVPRRHDRDDAVTACNALLPLTDCYVHGSRSVSHQLTSRPKRCFAYSGFTAVVWRWRDFCDRLVISSDTLPTDNTNYTDHIKLLGLVVSLRGLLICQSCQILSETCNLWPQLTLQNQVILAMVLTNRWLISVSFAAKCSSQRHLTASNRSEESSSDCRDVNK